MYKKGYVTDEYVENLLKRENEHPTGMNLSIASENIENIAIPHTESKYCCITKIAVIKLKKELIFKEMIDKNKDVPVKYMFMILNKQGEAQTGLLSSIIEFATNEENIFKMSKANDAKSLYEAIIQ